jgi:hypothetical protein
MYLLNQSYPDVKDKKEIIWDNYQKLTINEILVFTYDGGDERKVTVISN